MTAKEFKIKQEKLFAFLRRLICVPKCASCGERLSPFVTEDEINHGIPCLCDKCLAAWSRAKVQMCHNCGNVASMCTCMPKSKVFMQETIPSLFFYHPDVKLPESKAIYTLKHKKHIDLFDYVSIELSKEISEMLGHVGIKPEDCIFTYIPRTSKAIRKNGFDQSEILSKKVCRIVGGRCCLPLLKRMGGKEQKRLSISKRRKNADSSFYANLSLEDIGCRKRLIFKELVSGNTVILIDDIMTTGASFIRGVKVLSKAGAERVLIAAVARCEFAKKSKKYTKSK